jgi:hypothetical protein
MALHPSAEFPCVFLVGRLPRKRNHWEAYGRYRLLQSTLRTADVSMLDLGIAAVLASSIWSAYQRCNTNPGISTVHGDENTRPDPACRQR